MNEKTVSQNFLKFISFIFETVFFARYESIEAKISWKLYAIIKKNDNTKSDSYLFRFNFKDELE